MILAQKLRYSGEGGGGRQTEGRREVPLVLFLQVYLHKIGHHSKEVIIG